MTYLHAFIDEATRDLTWWVLGGLAVTVAALRVAPQERRRLRAILVFTLTHVALVLAAAATRPEGLAAYHPLHLAAVLFGGIAGIGMLLTTTFAVVLPRFGVRPPRILIDLVGAALLFVVVLALAREAGLNLAGLVATSAVVTAVIGLAFQDTLGNVVGGLALQSDRSVQVGDWIKVGDAVGKVVDIRWRYTALETRNGETVIVPNGTLVKSQVMVLGRRQGKPLAWRRWIWFNVDHRFAPMDVVAAAEGALIGAKIQNVATEPAPQCLLMELGESWGRYAVRYWLTDLAVDDPTDHEVRTRVVMALARAGIDLAMPAASLFLSQSTERDARHEERRRKRALDAVSRTELFGHLPEEDRRQLAAGLRPTPFTRGEIITRQGAEAHWLYIIVEGHVSVRVAVEGGLEREVRQLGAGQFFGEMSLMTGAPRLATVVALTNVQCYRLDSHVFEDVIKKRPTLAEEVADVLARRRVELLAVRDNLSQEAAKTSLVEARTDIVARIRSFFRLPEDKRSG